MGSYTLRPCAGARDLSWRPGRDRTTGRSCHAVALPPMLEAHLAKFRSLIPSLALLIHLVDEDKGPVGGEALSRACDWGDYLESHARRVYAAALMPAEAGARVLAGHIEWGDLGNRFTARRSIARVGLNWPTVRL